jgi:PAS domain S-box-containing protein
MYMPKEDDLYPSAFKAAVALAALRGDQTMEKLVERYSVQADLIREWSEVLAQNAQAAFAHPPDQSEPDSGVFDQSELAKTIAENSTQGLAMMDQRGYCIYANKAWLNMTGYSAQEISSKPLHHLVHHHRPDGSPYPMEECPIDRALPENFDVRAHEDVFFRKDGSTFDVACAASPIFRAGRPVATIIEIRDVTEQKRQAQQRIESEQRAIELARSAEQRQRQLNAFLDAAPVGIGMANLGGKIILLNRANRDLWGQNMLLAGAVEDYRQFKGWWADGAAHHGQLVLPGEWALARALSGEDVDNDIVEIEPFDEPGAHKTVSLSARPIRDSQGAITGAVVAQIDITRQKQAEDALRQSDRNKDEFIAILAHELRNPLAPIRAAVDLFRILGPNDAVLKRASDAMGRQVDHITRLVDDLLDVARISRGKVELKREACDFAKIVRQTTEDYRPTIEANDVALSIQAPSHPVWVLGDGARLAQVVGNLLHNASKFTSKGKRILVSVDEEAVAGIRHTVLNVEDNGTGMAPELVSTLFNPFIQAAQGLGRSTGGLGLGLALVKGLAELHDGTVTATSRGPGLGSRFTVRLPAAEHAQGDVPTAAEPTSQPGLRIVAIDDNKDALEMLGLLLAVNGHEVSMAYDGAGGVEMVQAVKPDVVICDIGLPGQMDGYDVVQRIRGNPEIAGTLVIALSGYGQESDRQKSAAAGFDTHLVKPVRHQDLEAALKGAKPRSGMVAQDA